LNVFKMMPKKIKIGGILFHTVLLLLSFTCLYPLFWLVINSVKTNSELFNNPWGFGSSIQIENYATAWISGKIGTSFFNSSLVSLSSVIITIFLSSTAAFAISRLKWKLSSYVLSLLELMQQRKINKAIIKKFFS
jgi:raffinose/stachyose/melibiose transport system permease protein